MPIASHQVVMQLWLLSSLVVDSVAIAGQTLVAVELGRGDGPAARAVSDRLLQVGGGVLGLEGAGSGRVAQMRRDEGGAGRRWALGEGAAGGQSCRGVADARGPARAAQLQCFPWAGRAVILCTSRCNPCRSWAWRWAARWRWPSGRPSRRSPTSSAVMPGGRIDGEGRMEQAGQALACHQGAGQLSGYLASHDTHRRALLKSARQRLALRASAGAVSALAPAAPTMRADARLLRPCAAWRLLC